MAEKAQVIVSQVTTVVDVRVLGDVAIVVVVDERVAVDRVVERQRGDHQQETQNYVALFRRREKSRRAVQTGFVRESATNGFNHRGHGGHRGVLSVRTFFVI